MIIECSTTEQTRHNSSQSNSAFGLAIKIPGLIFNMTPRCIENVQKSSRMVTYGHQTKGLRSESVRLLNTSWNSSTSQNSTTSLLF